MNTLKSKSEVEDFLRNVQYLELVYSLVGLLQGAIMLGVGCQYLSEDEGKYSCPNGAAPWLFISGIMALVAHLLNILANGYRKFAVKDGKHVCGPKFLLGCGSYRFSTVSIIIVEFTIIIWGSCIVFVALPNWTDDYKEYVEDYDKNYCNYTPMMTAFIVLIIKCSLLPFLSFLIIVYCGVYLCKEKFLNVQEELEPVCSLN